MRSFGGFLLGVSLLALPAFAQDSEGQDPPAQEAEAAPANKGSELDAEVSALSNDDKKERADAMLVDIRDSLKRATDILAEARGNKDIVQLNCINEKLTQIKGLLKIAEQSSVRMYEAMASGMNDVVDHEFTKTTVAHQKALVLRSEADQCVGESSVYTGDTQIEVETSDDGKSDPTTAGFAPAPAMPAISSPY